jgi:hypothetical protein
MHNQAFKAGRRRFYLQRRRTIDGWHHIILGICSLFPIEEESREFHHDKRGALSSAYYIPPKRPDIDKQNPIGIFVLRNFELIVDVRCVLFSPMRGLDLGTYCRVVLLHSALFVSAESVPSKIGVVGVEICLDPFCLLRCSLLNHHVSIIL